jgi:hypothetical protein
MPACAVTDVLTEDLRSSILNKEFDMSNDYGIVFVECMSFKPHKAHSWREGFLWYRKRHCGGRPKTEAEIWIWRAANPNLGVKLNEWLPPHKHSFKFKGVWSDTQVMEWWCDNCPDNVTCNWPREVFNKRTRGDPFYKLGNLRADYPWS